MSSIALLFWSSTFLIIASLSAGEPKMLRDASIPLHSYHKINWREEEKKNYYITIKVP